MTRRRLVIILWSAALIGAAFLIWRVFFPGDKVRIVRTLEAAAAALEIEDGESKPAALAKIHRLELRLDDGIDVQLRFNRQIYTGRYERRDAMAALAALRNAGVKLKVKLSDFNVTVSGDTAHAEAAATVTGRRNGEEFSLQEDLEVDLVRRKDEWLISKIAIRNFMEK